jgi:hypothetical protein
MKLTIKINQAERASMRIGIFPMAFPPFRINSITLPFRAHIAGIETTTAFNKTMANAAVDFILEDKKGIIKQDITSVIKTKYMVVPKLISFSYFRSGYLNFY